MRKIILSAIVLSLLLVGPVSAEKWNVDAVHSTLTFEVSHMVVSKAKGRFTDFSGSISFEGEDVASGSVEIVAQTASVDTDNEDRDGHLRSEDFLDVEKYPTMSFKSTKVSEVKDGKFALSGDLTIRDVTKKVTFDCVFRGIVKGMRGVYRTGFSAATTIDRMDYNVSWSSLLEGGGLALGHEVELKLEIEAVKATPDDDSKGESEDNPKDDTK